MNRVDFFYLKCGVSVLSLSFPALLFLAMSHIGFNQQLQTTFVAFTAGVIMAFVWMRMTNEFNQQCAATKTLPDVVGVF